MTFSEAQRVLSFRTRRVSGGSQVWLAVAGALVCVGSVVIAAGGASSDAAFGRGLLELLVVGVPIAVGLYALRAPVNRSFGGAMLGIGFAWSLTALGESTLSVPYTIGRLATWLIFVCAIYLLLIARPDASRRVLSAVCLLDTWGSRRFCSSPLRRSSRSFHRRRYGRRARPIARRTRSCSSSGSRRS